MKTLAIDWIPVSNLNDVSLPIGRNAVTQNIITRFDWDTPFNVVMDHINAIRLPHVACLRFTFVDITEDDVQELAAVTAAMGINAENPFAGTKLAKVWTRALDAAEESFSE